MSIQYMVLEFEPTTFETWVSSVTTRPGLHRVCYLTFASQTKKWQLARVTGRPAHQIIVIFFGCFGQLLFYLPIMFFSKYLLQLFWLTRPNEITNRVCASASAKGESTSYEKIEFEPFLLKRVWEWNFKFLNRLFFRA